MNAQLDKEKQQLLDQVQKQGSSGSEGRTKGVKGNWQEQEVQLLIKAVNLFPAGTSQRYAI